VFFPGIGKTETEDDHEDHNLNECNDPYLFHYYGPGEQEDYFRVKDKEEDGEQVVSDVELQPGGPFCRDITFFRFKLVSDKRTWI